MHKRQVLTKQRLNAWSKQYYSAIWHQARSLPLRQDMVTLLTFVRDNKIVGTQSTGNMPLKAVREVTAQFVHPPELDTVIGEHTYKLRSEANVWSLYFLHILADVSGLLAIAPARRWRLTSTGARFLDAPPLLQLSLLLTIWWYDVNWLIAYPFEGMGSGLPSTFKAVTLAHLRSLPVGEPISLDKFADGLIEETGLTWTAQNKSASTMFLHGAIRRMIVHILEDFGAVQCEYRKEPVGKRTISHLVTFQVTPLGQVLLDAVATMK